MIKQSLAAMFAIALVCGASSEVLAQNAVAGAGSISGAASQSGAGAAAVTGDTSVNFEGTQSRMVRGDQTKATIENVPDVIPPNLHHTNPCVISYSAGAGVVGIGAAIGFGIKDENCQDINTGVFLAQLEQGNEKMKGMNLALHFYCNQNDEVRKVANMRGMSDCGSSVVTPVAAVKPSQLPAKPPLNRFSQTPSGKTICTHGFDPAIGQCRKLRQQAFFMDGRQDG